MFLQYFKDFLGSDAHSEVWFTLILQIKTCLFKTNSLALLYR